jgi:hypothetical protein
LATYHAIAAVGQALLGLLASACPKPEFASAQFELYRAADFLKPMNDGISLYLYRVTVNTSLRNLPPRTGPDGRRYRPSLPLDLHYLMTAWGRTAAMQQRLLGWAIRTLEDTPILPQGVLNHYAPEVETFRPNETVELIMEVLSLQDMVNIWEIAKANQQPSVAYSARMVQIESNIELSEWPLVQARGFDLGKQAEPLQREANR